MSTSQIKNYSAILAVTLSLPVSTLLGEPHRTVKGNLNPMAQPQFDQGPVESSMKLGYMSLMLQRSARQQADLDQLLEKQQDLTSPLYHQWLTPEEFADRSGAAQEDVTKLTNWLQAEGFSVVQVARGRDFIVFSGTAGQVASSLHTEIHHYKINGEMHYANNAEPSVPEELAPLVAGIRGLHDIKAKAPKRRGGFPPMKIPAGARPDFYTTLYPNVNVIAPDDLATIYDINAYYKAGFDGTGQTLAIIGASDINLADIQYFRSAFNLPTNTPKTMLVPGSQDPGTNDAMGEADLDLEWSGAVARNATLVYVYGEDPFEASYYAIDQAIAPVMSFSFGLCELRVSPTDTQTMASEAQKAAAEGITWVASAGDSGAAGCEDQNGMFTSSITRMNVNLPAAIPNVTGVGGTEFNEGYGSYWAGSLGPNGGSAMGYVPETAWNDEAFIAQNNGSGFASGGGGASFNFSKPSWQTGAGVPSDGARDVPDVALTASWFHDPYALITGGNFVPNGGTSASAPSFAGIVVLLNEYLVKTGAQAHPGLGNINPMLYSLAQSAPTAFHDITSGSNIVPCVKNSTQDCTTGSMGYNAGPGYDLVAGLGSVDAYNLALSWKSAASNPSNSSKTAHLVVTAFTASTTAKAQGSFTVSWAITNEGSVAAGAFETAMLFTTNGDISTALGWMLYCNATGLAAGSTYTCSGTVNLDKSVTPGTYTLLAVADAKNQVTQSDTSGGTATASTGKLTVTQ